MNMKCGWRKGVTLRKKMQVRKFKFKIMWLNYTYRISIKTSIEKENIC